MTKDDAIKLLDCKGPGELADVLGLTPSAVTQWPTVLSRHAEDKVLAELWRRGRREGGGRCEACGDE